MFFDSWYDLFRIVIVGALAYAGLVFLLRITGKRTLSKMNAFDLVVTVALGSTLATVLLSKDVTLTEGLVAFLLLCALQYGVASSSLYSARFRDMIKAEPTLLFFRGRFLGPALRHERVTEDEVIAAMRSSGHAAMANVEAVVLETDGSFSVLGKGSAPADTLRTVNDRTNASELTANG
ncbi:DUF421 domain-containing protein [Aurantimonas sp. DM33-3]|uniref:DUF421 domain-containing protein n=1 Tax=Aurantimonas sp. DM33-3 TaxID=2766955 RepID=UPI0016524CAE|nr:YetF domain-containing protein [Aurantimonas sp. DM33-3]MBC6717451.1 DUF421 domain-containing protein [Aurantimonas sp. DM33-3]